MAIKRGEWIKVEYEGTLDDGGIFDSTDLNGGAPLKFQVGMGQLIKGFDESVVDKNVGEEYTIRLEPSEAYGEYKEGMTQKVPRIQFPKGVDLQPGLMLMVMGPQGQMPASIKSVEENEVTIDLNHPMAGKVLNFKIKIVETNCEPDPPSACGCGCGHDHNNTQDGCC
ncbi:MAG: FKBP-type peptidyl-prolyl cis-trans isomerase [Promethearchaeota archaeon]|jgi:FKBP-type peptidyl-prolyl cis-trans isomerase 2